MNNKYIPAEEVTATAAENTATYSPNIGIADALWALINAQTQEVQNIIAERIFARRNNSSAFSTAYASYHSREAITARFDAIEQSIDNGTAQWMSEKEVDNWVNSLA